jgi:predicted dehydrogenase
VHKAESAPARLLFVSTNPAQSRVKALRDALSPRASFEHIQSGLPDLTAFAAVVLDGAQKLSVEDVEQLSGYVEAGGRLLAIAPAEVGAGSTLAGLLGCTVAPVLPRGEFFGRLIDGAHPIAQRLLPEFAFVDTFRPLLPDAATPVLNVSVHFKEQVAVAERAVGSGNVTVSAIGATAEAFGCPELRAILARVLQPPNEGPMTRDLGVAIVGYGPLGGMGYTHALGVQGTAGLALAAICDTNSERLAAAGEVFPAAKLVRTVEEVATDPDVDIVIVATPPSSHTSLALQLLRAGKHVVCEKPLCFTLAEADELFDTALASGLVLTVNQNRRWDTDFLTIRRAISSGLLGEVFNIETFVGSFEHPCREWHSESTISGGAEFDWGAHYIDWILELMGGRPQHVFANGHKRVWHDVSNLDQVRVRMIWDDGREAEFLHSDVSAVRRPKFYIQGTEGTLVGHYRPLVSERIEPGRGYVREELHHAEAPADLTLVRYEPLGGGLREQKLALVQREPHAFYRNLADHLLLDDVPLAVDYRETRSLIAVLEAAHRSAELGGRPITPA